MKISQSKVRVEPYKAPVTDEIPNKAVMPKIPTQKQPPAVRVSPLKAAAPTKKAPMRPAPAAVRPVAAKPIVTSNASTSLQRMRAIAQQELHLIRRMRAEAEKYQQETAMKARSEAHRLILHTRLATQREIEDMIRQANEEIQKVLADIRVIRITAQEELAAQRKFTDAAKLNSMSISIQDMFQNSVEKKPKRKLETIKT